MSKVYVVTAGTYSNYHVVCIFADKEKAKHYIELYNRNVCDRSWYDEYNLEEYDTMDDLFTIEESGLMYAYAPGMIHYGPIGDVEPTTRSTYERVKATYPKNIFVFLTGDRAKEDVARAIAYDEEAKRKAEQAGIL